MFEPPINVSGQGSIPVWLYLDDVRIPAPVMGAEWVVVRSFHAFGQYLMNNPMPALISFDHDLGGFNKDWPGQEAPNGMAAAQWLVRYCMRKDLVPPLFTTHSQNPVGAENIRSLLNNFRKSEGLEPNGYHTFWDMSGTIDSF